MTARGCLELTCGHQYYLLPGDFSIGMFDGRDRFDLSYSWR
jgi:hypothetical protein